MIANLHAVDWDPPCQQNAWKDALKRLPRERAPSMRVKYRMKATALTRPSKSVMAIWIGKVREPTRLELRRT